MQKVYFLSTCSTSKRIIADFKLKARGFEFQDIKFDKITEEQIDHLADLAGSYEGLFSRIARKYKELNLKGINLTEADYKNYILAEYTFLKRPVIVINDLIFIGSGKPNLLRLEEELS